VRSWVAGRRSLAGAAAVAAAFLVAANVLWLGAARPFAGLPADSPVTVSRIGYWQQARFHGEARRGLIAALGLIARSDAVRPRRGEGGAGGGAAPGAGPSPPPPSYRIVVGDQTLVYRPGAARLTAGRRTYRLPAAADLALREAVGEAERRFHGELVTWAAANRLFPLGADATVVDLATGLRFRVRRLGGSRHADVQPLTAADAAVMRRIYGGRWSWARRPVLVEVGGRRLAASMNGMPHGAGSIAGNDFPGHSCIHFLLSTLHSSGRIDPAHLMAVLSAAGVRPRGPARPGETEAEAAAC
jgi:hypothetical protein